MLSVILGVTTEMTTNFYDKIKRVVAAAGKLSPGITHIEVKHDAGCLALKTEKLADCTCNPVIRKRGPDA
jgi:hypothetical protein